MKPGRKKLGMVEQQKLLDPMESYSISIHHLAYLN